ncbi:ChaN family lipoprotein [uncultured Aquimarina sp.]|uniref:ChaN family lipoprotein n=1 Tax=uncultured Aquimarina sp. TaxID=575652 RepID=UPI0026213010|nr:ChaN family lipoprotein [uncultured Aquimarina sp.]
MLKKEIFIIIAFLFIVKSSSQEFGFAEELSYLKEKGVNPITYVIKKFNDYDFVILGEDHAIKDNLDFVDKLIPELYQAGVYTLGMEFGAYEKQPVVNSLLQAKTYNEQIIRDVMYFYNVGWAYKEYMDIYKTVWEFNKRLPSNSRKFRILNVSYQYNWSVFSGIPTPENMSKVFHMGPPNIFRAKVVDQEIAKKDDKILLLVGTPHAFTRYQKASVSKNNDGFCAFDNGSLGNILYEKYPSKVFSIFLHGPFYNKPNKTPFLVSPAFDHIEKIAALSGNKPMGFDLQSTPFGELKDDSIYATCYPDFRLGQLFDGYIFLVPFNKMKSCTIDSDFFKGKDWNATKMQLPDPYWHEEVNSYDEYWKQIRNYGNVKSRYKTLINK